MCAKAPLGIEHNRAMRPTPKHPQCQKARLLSMRHLIARSARFGNAPGVKRPGLDPRHECHNDGEACGRRRYPTRADHLEPKCRIGQPRAARVCMSLRQVWPRSRYRIRWALAGALVSSEQNNDQLPNVATGLCAGGFLMEFQFLLSSCFVFKQLIQFHIFAMARSRPLSIRTIQGTYSDIVRKICILRAFQNPIAVLCA